jgi:hypothetical protein
MDDASGSDDNALATLLDALNMAGSGAFYCTPQSTNIVCTRRQWFPAVT